MRTFGDIVALVVPIVPLYVRQQAVCYTFEAILTI